MTKKTKKILKILITVAIGASFIWFLIISPLITFKNNETKMLEAAKRYYEINPSKLPTGNRLSTVNLKTLYDEAYLKEDLYIPLSINYCDINKSWVKVKQKDGKYTYYPYLECGTFKSKTDHQGPTITLNGEEEITINKDEKYKELGVKKVTDDTDGTIDTKEVLIDNSKVDTSKIGTYSVTYTVTDSFKNTTVVKRKVNVIQNLNTTVKNATDETNIYKGMAIDNYLNFSGITFRIIGLDKDNVKIVSDSDLANVNYENIDDWLDYFYDKLTKEAKDLLVENTYCKGELSEEEILTNTKCLSKTKKRASYILSNYEINSSLDENKTSYLFPTTISWTANTAPDKTAWTIKDLFNQFTELKNENAAPFSKDYNFGIRPLLTIKGNVKITSGTGTINDPYSLNETPKAKAGDYLYTRHPGEYINYSGYTWRIISTEDDNPTKVISSDIIKLANDEQVGYTNESLVKKYNPTEKGNVAYYINQKTSDTVDEKYFVTKEIEVPIYKTIAKYGNETETKKYKTKFSAPNMYEIFSAYSLGMTHGYWLLNSSKEEYRKYFISNNGVVFYEISQNFYKTYIRPVGYLDKNCKIVSGSGTLSDPYKIKK